MDKDNLKKLHKKLRMQRLEYEKQHGRKVSKSWNKNKGDDSSRTSRRKLKQELSYIRYNKKELE